MIREQSVTIVIQGDAEKVRQRFYNYLDETLGTDGEEIEAYPMPNSDERLVPADEFYETGEA